MTLTPVSLIRTCGPVAMLLAISTAAHAEFALTACDLISRPEVESAFHLRMGNGSARLNGKLLTSCSFKTRRGTVSILLHRSAPQVWIAERIQRVSGPGKFRPVSGVADSAFFLDRQDEGAALCVFQGGHYLQVSVFHVGDADTVLPGIEELVRNALAALNGATPATETALVAAH